MSIKQKIIGTYELGHEYVELVAVLDDSGGCFYFQPEKGHIARIKVGLDYHEWSECVSTFLHEAFEFALTRHRLRMRASGDLTNDHASYLFVFSHSQFSHICGEVGLFTAQALPDVAAAYTACKKNRASRKS